MCPGKFAVLQNVSDEPLDYCPGCGLECKRVISRANIKTGTALTASNAAKKGFTTWKRVGEGKWEKLDGPGVDAIEATPEEIQAVKDERVKKVEID